MKRAAIAIFVGGALIGASCLFLPDIGGYGYASCTDSKACGPGRSCQAGYCAPPPWWDEKYAARHQVLVENSGSTTVAAGAVLEFLVGENGALTFDDKPGVAPALVFDDRSTGEQRRATAFREQRGGGESYAFVFKLPVDVAPKTTFGNLWLYTRAADDVAPSYSLPGEVYGYFDGFDGEALVANEYRIDPPSGSITVADGQAVVRSNTWLVTVDTFSASEAAVDLQLYGANCRDFGFGFGAGRNPQSLDPPYAMFMADASGTIRHEVLPSPQAQVEELGTSFPADGQPHRFAVAVAGARVVFRVDGIVTADGEPASVLDGELHLHLYSNDCQMRVESLYVAPQPTEMPTVSVEDAVTWYR